MRNFWEGATIVVLGLLTLLSLLTTLNVYGAGVLAYLGFPVVAHLEFFSLFYQNGVVFEGEQAFFWGHVCLGLTCLMGISTALNVVRVNNLRV